MQVAKPIESDSPTQREPHVPSQPQRVEVRFGSALITPPATLAQPSIGHDHAIRVLMAGVGRLEPFAWVMHGSRVVVSCTTVPDLRSTVEPPEHSPW